MSQKLNSLEEYLMRAMQLENIDQLDELLARPISVYAREPLRATGRGV